MLHADHYNTQELRNYPLDDNATGVGDDGTLMPSDILVDCRLRLPETLGRFAFLGGMSVTDKLVTFVILGTDAQDSVSDFTPLASITVVLPIPGVPYPVRPLAAGVGGWVVFGPAVMPRGGGVDRVAVRFSSPTQSLLAPKCARPYKLPPVPSLGKAGRSTALTGFVTIKGGADVEVVKELVRVADAYRDALVVRLKQIPDGENVLAKYIGPCDKRPESRNCPRDGIEAINNVTPDCDGNINIRVENLSLGSLENCGGLTLGYAGDLTDACAEGKIRPGIDQCQESLDAIAAGDSSSSSGSAVSFSASSESLPCYSLPYFADFDSSEAEGLTVEEGYFVFDSYDAPNEEDEGGRPADIAFTAIEGATRNIAVIGGCNLVSSQIAVCEVALSITTEYPIRNGGIVVNYRLVDPLTNPHIEYFLVLVDMNVNKLKVLRFNGITLVEEYASPSALPLLPGAWYKLRVTTSPFGEQTAIAVHLDGLDDPADLEVNFSIATNKFGDTNGRFGIGTNRAYTLFSYFHLENG
jgi:hypothetical protein